MLNNAKIWVFSKKYEFSQGQILRRSVLFLINKEK